MPGAIVVIVSFEVCILISLVPMVITHYYARPILLQLGLLGQLSFRVGVDSVPPPNWGFGRQDTGGPCMHHLPC